MPSDVAERIEAGMVAAWRDRVRHLDGHVVDEVDGIVVCLSNLPDDQLNVALVARDPLDPLGAIAAADRLFASQGRRLGLDLPRDRHPAVEAALRAIGLRIVATRPAMAVTVQDVEPPTPPGDVELMRMTDATRLEALVEIEVAGFGTDRAVAERLLSLPPRTDAVRVYAALVDGRPVAQALTNLHAGALGIFGVATIPAFRRRGIGGALTAFAIDDRRDEADLAWLQSSGGRTLYERMGLRHVVEWDVWSRAGSR